MFGNPPVALRAALHRPGSPADGPGRDLRRRWQTANLLAVWRLHGIDQILRRALSNGTILYGSSAGGLCWFESGITDSLSYDETLRPLHAGLGIVAGSHSPHFDRPGRADLYASMVASGELPSGIGVDDYAAVHFVDGAVHRVVTVRPGAGAYLVAARDEGSPTVTALGTTAL